MTRNHVWICNERVYEARPIADVINDGHPEPDNKAVKWVVFRVFTREHNTLEVDACGYARTLAEARRGVFIH